MTLTVTAAKLPFIRLRLRLMRGERTRCGEDVSQVHQEAVQPRWYGVAALRTAQGQQREYLVKHIMTKLSGSPFRLWVGTYKSEKVNKEGGKKIYEALPAESHPQRG